MKRRNFLLSLLALPFAPERLRASTPRHLLSRAEIEALVEARFAEFRNTEALDRLSAALLRAPTGFKIEYHRYTADEAKRIYDRLSEKK